MVVVARIASASTRSRTTASSAAAAAAIATIVPSATGNAGEPIAGCSTIASALAPAAYGSIHQVRGPLSTRRCTHGMQSASSKTVCSAMNASIAATRWLWSAPARWRVVARRRPASGSSRPMTWRPTIGDAGATPRCASTVGARSCSVTTPSRRVVGLARAPPAGKPPPAMSTGASERPAPVSEEGTEVATTITRVSELARAAT